MLNKQQLSTLIHLKNFHNFDTPEEVIDYCKKKLELSRFRTGISKKNRRRFSKEHYRGIIKFMEGKNNE